MHVCVGSYSLSNQIPLQFMEQERASSLLQFWLTAENFYNELSSPAHIPDVETDTTDAMAIYDRLLIYCLAGIYIDIP